MIMKDPCKYIIKHILKLKDGEKIGEDDLEILRVKLKMNDR